MRAGNGKLGAKTNKSCCSSLGLWWLCQSAMLLLLNLYFILNRNASKPPMHTLAAPYTVNVLCIQRPNARESSFSINYTIIVQTYFPLHRSILYGANAKFMCESCMKRYTIFSHICKWQRVFTYFTNPILYQMHCIQMQIQHNINEENVLISKYS